MSCPRGISTGSRREALHHKIDILRTIPNLRKISISPWNKIEQAAERIAGEVANRFG
jgi:hypothetical protein